jgi:hypothetical protein
MSALGKHLFDRPLPPEVGPLASDAVDGALALGLSLLQVAGDPYSLSLDYEVELPPVLGGTEQEQAALRTAAPLYLAAELESTRLLPVVEVLAGLFASGALPGDPGPGGELLFAFRRAARDRLAAAERDALFARLFGKPYGAALAGAGTEARGRNEEFELLMIDLCEALGDSEPGLQGGAVGEVRLHVTAGALAANLGQRVGGVASYAARDCLEALRDGLAVLKVPQVQALFGARSVWTTVREVARRYLGQETDIVSRVARGRAGTTLLAWLADVLPRVGSTGERLVPPGSPVSGAAVGWMQATLTLHETSAAAASQAPHLAA